MATGQSSLGTVYQVVGSPEHAATAARLWKATLVYISPPGLKGGAWLANGYATTEPVRDCDGDGRKRFDELGTVLSLLLPVQRAVIGTSTWVSPNPEWLAKSVLTPLGMHLGALVWAKESARDATLTSQLPLLGCYVARGTPVRQVDVSDSEKDPDGVNRRLLAALAP